MRLNRRGITTLLCSKSAVCNFILPLLAGLNAWERRVCMCSDETHARICTVSLIGRYELKSSRTAIKDVICGVRIEEIEYPLMREIRYQTHRRVGKGEEDREDFAARGDVPFICIGVFVWAAAM